MTAMPLPVLVLSQETKEITPILQNEAGGSVNPA